MDSLKDKEVAQKVKSLKTLRDKAESVLNQHPELTDDLDELQLKDLIRELEVHQLELLIQYQELIDAQLKLIEVKDQYVALYDYAPVTFLTLDFSGVIQKCNQAAVQLFGMKSHVLTGKSLQHFIHEDSQTVFRLHKSRLFDTHANQISDLELNADGKEIFVRMESQLDLTNTNLVGCWHVALTDTTVQVNLQRNLAKLNSELERRVAVRTRKYEESRLELYSILNAAADSIITLNAEGEIVHINKATEYIFGYHKDELVGANVRLLIPYTGFGQHENFIQNIVKQTSCPETLAYTVQLMGRKKSGAVFPATISIARVDNLNRFTAVLRDDSQIRKLQREVMRVAEMERSRISRELHDSLGQELVGIAMLAKSIAQDYGEKDIQLAQNFQRMSEILGGCVKRLRQIIFELAPLELSDSGLVDALRSLESVVRANGMECDFTFSNPPGTAGPEIDIQLLRVAQEAVHNAIKHANASRISLALTHDEGSIELAVADNGCGISNTQMTDKMGQGIRIMQYRANAMGGKLEIEPNAPTGTKVVCRLETINHEQGS